MRIHTKCRGATYPGTNVQRLNVPDDKVPWTVQWPDYKPPEYSIPGLSSKPWADPELGLPEELQWCSDIISTKGITCTASTTIKSIPQVWKEAACKHIEARGGKREKAFHIDIQLAADFSPCWNTLDGNVNRRSHEGTYAVVDGRPLNPHGRTGLSGRGRLGRWGPNHAGDPIVTRWKRDTAGTKVVNQHSQLPVLQFVAIARRDSGEWAIPGGMVDPGELVSATLRREFSEETMNSLSLSEKDRHALEKSLESFFSKGVEVYKGYVDDPRNTDNAWMETVACNFHDESGNITGKFALEAGDDAAKVKWTDISKELCLYASHSDFVHEVVERLKAHW